MIFEHFLSISAIPWQFLLLGFTVSCFLILRERRSWRRLRNIPGPPKIPFFGSSLALNVPNHRLLDVFGEWIHRYGKRVFIANGTSSRIILCAPNDIEKVLGSQVHINKGRDYDFLKPWLGFGLVTNKGEMWFRRRKMLTPSFHFNILEKFLDVFNEQASTLMHILETEFGDGKVFDISPYITRCALDMIFETAMGTKLNAQSERDSEYVKALHRINDLIVHRIFRPWLHPNFLWELSPSGREEKTCLRTLHGLTENLIRERKCEISQRGKEKQLSKTSDVDVDSFTNGKERLVFLDLLIEAQSNEIATTGTSTMLTDLSIREEADTFLFAGHDTTTANLNWALFIISSYPHIQEKVQAELDDIFGDAKDRPITSDDLTRMKYLECCIKEIMRLYPSVPLFSRRLGADLQLDSDVKLANGVIVYIIPYFTHRDPSLFPNPETFSPERFLPENAKGRHPYAYIPFSAGPRNCIGQKFAMMEVKVVLANFFRTFNSTAIEKRENIQVSVDVILRPKNGVSIILSRRT